MTLHAATSGDTMTVFWLNPNSDTCCLGILRQNLQKQQDPQVIPGIGLKQESQQRLVCNLRICPCQGAGHRRVHDQQNLSASAGVGSTVASYALDCEQFAVSVGPLVDATIDSPNDFGLFDAPGCYSCPEAGPFETACWLPPGGRGIPQICCIFE